MGHHISAIVGKREALAALIDRLGTPHPTALAFDLVIVPLDEQRLDEIATSTEPSFTGFTYLTPEIADGVGRLVPSGRALYVETNYFGGMGEQSAALFREGALSWKRVHSTFEGEKRGSFLGRLFAKVSTAEKSPISEGLAEFGVVPEHGHDEFDAVGLARFRTLEALGLDHE